ncbi:uncharacterized protein EI97DRAFT_470080 [Westerdykella ornata]|uniref:Lysine-specific metallo-endopeptidase domain-containing protein n=1 Tax=Westerdykella ornata TaxID=318751 RepID=A0A6A6J965_WESOR|nr:uncharacterized protein EI97DRAFT_470080 [Westerdykella ornata]KAF2272817.1 hypothetical protein EI97DRAFT_470080 [Westerdykella ornata]
MGPFVRTPLLLLVLALQAASFIVIDRRCDASEKGALEIAIRETKEIAQAAVDAMNARKIGNSEEAYKGAYDPLFGAGAYPNVKGVMEKVVSLHDDQGFGVTVYCKGGMDQIFAFVPGPPERTEDRDFQNAGKGEGERKVYPAFAGNYQQIFGGDKSNLAANLHGYTPEPGKFDFANQAHIYLTKGAFEIDPKYDSRPVKTIRESGLSTGHSQLDSIQSTTTILLHELMHVAGGLRDPFKQRPGNRIRDGPDGLLYDWKRCVIVAANWDRFQIKTEETADCLMKFALACYLQPPNKDNAPTCWNLGNVDPNTGKPAKIEETGAWIKRSLEVMDARARWHARAFR